MSDHEATNRELAELRRQLVLAERERSKYSKAEIEAAESYLDRQIAELEQEHGRLDQRTRDDLAVCAGVFADSDPLNAIKLGYELLQKQRRAA